MASQSSKAFKDISLSFQPHPVTGDIPVLKNENAIKRAVRNLIETSAGERPFKDVLALVFVMRCLNSSIFLLHQ